MTEEIKDTLATCEVMLDVVKNELERIAKRLDQPLGRAAHEVRQGISQLREATDTIKREILGTPLPTIEEVRGIFAKQDWTYVSGCGCRKCNAEFIKSAPKTFRGMIICPECGNKRCPHASDHTYACTDSNAPGQPGSVFA